MNGITQRAQRRGKESEGGNAKVGDCGANAVSTIAATIIAASTIAK
ncbi:MAG: hypothetical protein K2K23_05020 [Muribaculaceae bacterium]|nr:hypothetical protein [Muribaculaceae bacterium]